MDSFTIFNLGVNFFLVYMDLSKDSYLEIVMETVLDGLIIIDHQGMVQTINSAALKAFGYSKDEVIGQNVKMLMPEPYQSEHDGYLANFAETGDKKVIGMGREILAKRKNGVVFPMELGVNQMEVDGKVLFVGTIRDISERAAVMETVLDGLIVISRQGTIKNFNASASKIFGYKKSEVIGQNVKILMPDPYQSAHDGYLDNYNKTGDKKIIGIGREILAKRKDGSIFPMELGVNEMQVGGDQLFVGTIRDISARKQAEIEIQEFVKKLKISNQELDQFAYIASHDLKEPLRGLANNALFLQEDYEDVLDDDGNKRIDRINFLCKRMEQLVDNLLYYSRLGRHELAIVETDLNQVIKKIKEVSFTEDTGMVADISVTSQLPTVVCDQPKVTELFRNLISNGIKYNKKAQKKIEVGVTEKVDPASNKLEKRVFYVRDNGEGIEEKFFSDVFRIFKRLNEEDDKVRGSGVGLTFVKKIVERHEGNIWLESSVGEGTTFFFTLNMETS